MENQTIDPWVVRPVKVAPFVQTYGERGFEVPDELVAAVFKLCCEWKLEAKIYSNGSIEMSAFGEWSDDADAIGISPKK